MSKFSYVLTFIGGAAIGSLGTWYTLKRYFEDKTEKEIESVKEAYNRPITHEQIVNIGKTFEKGLQDSVTAVGNTLKSNSIIDEVKERGYVPEIKKSDKPYPIGIEDFGEYYEYEEVYLTFYADNVVTDNEGNMLSVKEVEESCGLECLTEFDDDEDEVYARNDAKKCDYQITRDPRNYCEVIPTDDDDN